MGSTIPPLFPPPEDPPLTKDSKSCKKENHYSLPIPLETPSKRLKPDSISPIEQIEQMEETAKIGRIFVRKFGQAIRENVSILDIQRAAKEVIFSFLVQLEAKGIKSPAIQKFYHDLKNKQWFEITEKYLATRENQPDELRPFLEFLKQKNEEFPKEKIEEIILNNFERKAANRDPLMALLIQAKRDTNPDFRCYVVDVEDLSDAIHTIQKQKHSSIQLLVRNDVHYTAIALDYSEASKKACILESNKGEDNAKLQTLITSLQESHHDMIYVLGDEDKIQYDFWNCAFFAFENALQVSKTPQFFEILDRLASSPTEGVVSLKWLNMPPQFVKNATSLSFQKKYEEKHGFTEAFTKFKNIGFRAFIESNTAQETIHKSSGPQLVSMNTALQRKQLKRRVRIEMLLEKTTAQEIKQMIINHSLLGLTRS